MNLPAGLIVNNPKAIFKGAWQGSSSIGDSIMNGDLDIEGDWADFIQENMDKAIARIPYFRKSIKRTKEHYNIPAEFYEIVLGPTMSYTCANYNLVNGVPTHKTLNSAQYTKYLFHGEWLGIHGRDMSQSLKVLDCGCGWGGFSEHAATIRLHSVDGISISREQIEYAKKQNINGDANFYLSDWLDWEYWVRFGLARKNYDRFTAQGMLEHVGQDNLQEFFQWVNYVLKPNGIGTLQFISRDKPMNEWFDKRIFPGAYPPNFNEVCRWMKRAGLTITDTKIRAEDYVLTLKAWLHNLESNVDKIKALGFDDKFIRMFKLYFSGGIASFRSGESQLVQLRFVKGKR